MDPTRNAYDVFVSYASSDDDMPPRYGNWVTEFQKALRKALNHKVGRPVSVYFAPENAKSYENWQEVDKYCRQAKVFVAILSPSYLGGCVPGGWPQRELDAFVDSGKANDSLLVVALSKVAETTNHPILRPRTHIKFYGHDRQSDKDGQLFAPSDDQFSDRVMELAEDIRDRLAAADAGTSDEVVSPKILGPVLLAMPTDDLDEEYWSVRRYLENVGAEVLPHADYPLGGDDFKAAFKRDLDQAKLVVQLLGKRAGRRPPDLPEGYTAFQTESVLASNMPLMQWRSVALAVDEVEDAAYRRLLKGAAVVASTLEAYKGEVRKQLEAIAAPPTTTKLIQTDETGTKSLMVFVNAELSDRSAAEYIMDSLGDRYHIFIPEFAKDASNQQDYEETLQICDAVLVLYGSVAHNWVYKHVQHTIKSTILKRSSPPTSTVCHGPPPGERPRTFRSPTFLDPLDCRTPDGNDWNLKPIEEMLARITV